MDNEGNWFPPNPSSKFSGSVTVDIPVPDWSLKSLTKNSTEKQKAQLQIKEDKLLLTRKNAQ